MHNVETRLWIAGKYAEGHGEKFPLFSPATDEHVADVHSANKEDVDRAVNAALAAQPAWAKADVKTRQTALYKLADLVEKHGDKLAQLDAMSMGKPVGVDRMMLPHIVGAVRNCAGLASSSAVLGETSLLTPGAITCTFRQPFGVTAGILPFNVPALMFLQKAAPAVAAGNAIILKSSEKSPLSAAYLAQLTREAGLPDGIVQVLSGGGDTGRLLAEHPHIRKISFTGSVATGKKVAAAAATSNLKDVSLELGGKSPVVIFEDANIEKAAAACAFSIMFNSGQACIANSRMYIHEAAYDRFMEQIKASMLHFKHGDPLKDDTSLGPQADKTQGEKVAGYMEVGAKEGKVVVGGKKVGSKGWFFEPTLFVDVAEDARINREEIFGPVGVVHKFSDEKDVLRRCNDTEYGLYASVFTQSIDRAMRFAREVEAGTVTINAAAPAVDPHTPFGGMKQSGMGREQGSQSVARWLEEKTVVIKLDE
ncbi:hypothetical protein JCM10213_007173 [Rhodosporidiobolus nylandii]